MIIMRRHDKHHMKSMITVRRHDHQYGKLMIIMRKHNQHKVDDYNEKTWSSTWEVDDNNEKNFIINLGRWWWYRWGFTWDNNQLYGLKSSLGKSVSRRVLFISEMRWDETNKRDR